MLDLQIQQQLKQHFAKIITPVVLQVNLDESKKSAELLILAQDIADLSDQISVQQQADPKHKMPSLAIATAANEETTAVRFSGIPSGHEFSSLILAILQQGGHAPSIKAELLTRISDLALQQPVSFVSYISLSCQTCPAVVQALNTLAIQHPMIQHEMVDGSLFQDEVKQKNILSVPSVFLDDQLFSQGAISLESILNKIDSNGAKAQTELLNARKPYDVIVVGGGPAGASAAIYSARKGLRTAVVAERFGGQVMDTLAIENFISVSATQGPKLAASLEQHVLEYDVDIIDQQKVSKLYGQFDSDSGNLELALESGAQLQSQAVILATGARWREMQVPGEREYRGRGVAYCPHCDGPLFKGKDVAVIGGGNSGIEAAIDLAGIVKSVTVLEFADTLRADEVLQRKANATSNIRIIRSAQSTAVIGNGDNVTGLDYLDRNTDQAKHLALDGIFVQIGLMPNTEFLKDTVVLNNRGEIEVDAQGHTSLPGVFAAGDVTTSPYKQIIIAMGSGATAALGAFDHMIRQEQPATQAA